MKGIWKIWKVERKKKLKTKGEKKTDKLAEKTTGKRLAIDTTMVEATPLTTAILEEDPTEKSSVVTALTPRALERAQAALATALTPRTLERVQAAIASPAPAAVAPASDISQMV